MLWNKLFTVIKEILLESKLQKLNASTFKPVFKKYFLTYKLLCINGESLYLTVSALNRHDLVCNNFSRISKQYNMTF